MEKTGRRRDAFISYRSTEFETADWVRSVLETNGISCWMAPADIPGGSSYAVEIPNAIKDARVFVVVLSRQAQESTWVPKELDIAINEHKVILPFMLEDFQLRDDFNFYLSNVQRYAAYENKTTAMEKMVREIHAIIGLENETTSEENTMQTSGTRENNDVRKRINAPTNSKKARNQRRRVLSIALIACALAAAVIIWKISHPATPTVEPAIEASAPEAQQTESEDPQEEEEETTLPTEQLGELYHITLHAPEDMTVRQFMDARKILHDRVEIFTGGRAFEIVEQEDTIDLFLPSNSFAMERIETALRCYLTRAIRFYLIDEKDSSNHSILFTKEDLESVTLHVGQIPDVDAASYGVNDEEYQYIVITLSDEFVSAHQAEYETWEKITVGQDVEEFPNSYYFYYCFPAGDGKNFYVLNNDLGGNYSEMVVHNLTHDSMAKSFTFVVDINYQVNWENSLESLNRGALQCNYEDFSEGTISSLYTTSKMTKGELIDTIGTVKKRMDALGLPYAIGWKEDENGYKIAIKTKVDRMNQEVSELLQKSYASVVVQAQDYIVNNLNIYRTQIEAVGDHVYKIIFRALGEGTEARTRMEAFMRLVDQEGLLPTLFLDDIPVFAVNEFEWFADRAEMKVSDLAVIRDGVIGFQPITDENSWYVDFLAAILNNEDAKMQRLSLSSTQHNPDATGAMPDLNQQVELLYMDTGETERQIAEVFPDMDYNYARDKISISMHLPLNDQFAENAVSSMETIFNLLREKGCYFKTLEFYLTDEEGPERARIFFSWDNYSDSDEAEVKRGSYYYYGMINYGRLANYREEMLKALEGSAFFQEHTGRLTDIW